MQPKTRVTVTVDRAVLRAGAQAVRRGLARSLSDWANAALEARAQEDLRARAASAAVSAYEREHGAFSDDELAAVEADDTAKRKVVRPRARRASKRAA
jgi:hypothetical protein